MKKKKEEQKELLKAILSESRIFKPCEIEVLLDRYDGKLSDKKGYFSARIKPKIIEIKLWNESNLKKVLNKFLNEKESEKIKNMKEETKRKKEQEITVEEFQSREGLI